MTNQGAYHLVVHTLEGHAGWTPQARFASAVRCAVDGHLPYERYHAAGRARAREGIGEGAIERAVSDWMATDLNPAVQNVRMLRNPVNAIRAYNAYNNSAPIAVRTQVMDSRLGGAPVAGTTGAGVRRDLVSTRDDPDPCRQGTLIVADTLIGVVRRNARSPYLAGVLGVGQVARLLGVESSAAAEYALLIEACGLMSVPHAARKLGCHPRTLQRRLRDEDLSAELVGQAVRMVRATARLGSTGSLTTLALEEGFSDHAHMTRAFRAACGLSPSQLQAAIRGDALPD